MSRCILNSPSCYKVLGLGEGVGPYRGSRGKGSASSRMTGFIYGHNICVICGERIGTTVTMVA